MNLYKSMAYHCILDYLAQGWPEFYQFSMLKVRPNPLRNGSGANFRKDKGSAL